MKSFLIIAFFIIGLANFNLSNGQTFKLDYNSIDYGSVKEWKNDTTWFYISNTSSKKWFILPTFYDQRFKLLYSNKPVLPGEKMKMGVSYYTEDKGKFKIDIPFYISSEQKAINITIMGKIIDFHPDALVYCPNLDPKNPKEMDEFILTEKNVDSSSIIQITALEEDEEVLIEEDIIIEEEVLIEEEKQDDDKIEVDEIEVDEIDVDEIDVDEIKVDEIKVEVLDTFNSSNKKEKDTISNLENLEEVKTIEPVFSKTDPINNLVFLIDISGSMKRDNKLENVKASIKELIAAMRPEDNITVITYASRAKLLFNTSAFEFRDSLYVLIDSLKADGHSYGKEGLDMAYGVAQDYFVSGGNNCVVLATDGKFNYKDFSENRLYKQASKQALKKLKLSVMAFGDDEKSLRFLKRLATFGNGKYVHFPKNMDASSMLIGMIKSLSVR
mgnify:CR=1 FL=1